MEYRRLGKSGLEVSLVGIGCNNFGRRCDLDQTRSVVNRAIDLGINFFDTADIYGEDGKSEEFLGKAISDKRQSVIIATKFAGNMGTGPMESGASRKHIMDAVEASLQRLGTDYIDLYQVHFPDLLTPLEETISTLDDLVRAGKVRYIGHSNFAGWQIAHAHWIAEHHHLTPFISAQNHWSLLEREVESEVIPSAKAFGLGVLPYFPLASGLLTGKYKRNEPAPSGTRLVAGPMADRVLTEKNFDIVESLEAFTKEKGHSILELAFSWLACNPNVSSVIAGATRPEQVESNVESVSWKLTADEISKIDELTNFNA
ncbi:MAG: aldo/keto reductase [Chloroflexi bacterium]|nr:aldo/keto reductase [Chloroflexota bacterium]|tara:strand:+ start:10278 stop:11222 length:945 start_codon:yes stop_codon:yes gene_type:complete